MKRVITITVLLTLICSFFACSGNKENEQLVERSIDGIAEYLGYTDGEEIEIKWNDCGDGAGAEAGKYFKDGRVTIYEFNPESKMYEYWTTQTDMCIDGFVILYDMESLSEMTDYELDEQIKKIQSIKFKSEK